MNSASQIQSLEISIENLIKTWKITQKWRMLLSSRAKQEQERAFWRTHLSNFLESTPIRIATITLLLVDLIVTSLELSSTLISCPKKTNTMEENLYHWIGIIILSILCLRSLSLFVGHGKSFFCKPGYVLDSVVVIVALILESYFERKGGGLVIVASLWSVVRVVESAFELSDEAIEAQIEQIVFQFETLTDENARLLEIIVEKDLTIEKLQEELDISAGFVVEQFN